MHYSCCRWELTNDAKIDAGPRFHKKQNGQTGRNSDLSRVRLPDLDSNQDKQSQSLSYYRYTIRQLEKKGENSFIFGCEDNLDS
jgi:hypothetical protein